MQTTKSTHLTDTSQNPLVDSATQYDLRADTMGIGQQGRRQDALRAAETARPLLWKMLRSQLAAVAEADDPRQTLASVAGLVPDFIRDCARFNLVVRNDASASPTRLQSDPVMDERREAEWQKIQTILPRFQAPNPSDELLSLLTAARSIAGHIDDSQFREFQAEIVDAQVLHLAEMIDFGAAGAVLYRKWNEAGYSYVVRIVDLSIDAVKPKLEKMSVDPEAPFGQRVEYRATVSASGRADHVTEEHVHHLQRAAERTFAGFKRGCGGSFLSGHRPALQSSTGRRIPARVAELCEAVPEWLSPHLSVMEGKIVEEEVHRRDAYQTEWKSTIVKTWKDSPAIALGDVVLTGWSDSDMHEKEERTPDWSKWALGGAAAVSGLLLLHPATRPFARRAAASLFRKLI